MQRLAQGLAASLLATAAFGAGSIALAPERGAAAPTGALYALFESLMVLRDGHGARHPVSNADIPGRKP